MSDDLRSWAERTFGLSYLDEFWLYKAWGVLRGKAPIMKEILTKLWTDPAYFRGAMRAAIGVLAGLVLSGKIVLPDPLEKWVWSIASLWPAILALPAGQSNPTPEQVKAISVDPTIRASDTTPTAGAPIVTGK